MALALTNNTANAIKETVKEPNLNWLADKTVKEPNLNIFNNPPAAPVTSNSFLPSLLHDPTKPQRPTFKSMKPIFKNLPALKPLIPENPDLQYDSPKIKNDNFGVSPTQTKQILILI